MGRKLFKIKRDQCSYKVYVEDVITVYKKIRKLMPKIPRYKERRDEEKDHLET